MPKNVLEVWPQIFAVAAGVVVLTAAALAFSFRHKPHIQPGSEGHRPDEEHGDAEIIGPDGYIDSFAGTIEEAGGGLPLMGKLVIAAVGVFFVVYLVLYWNPGV